MQRRNRRGRKRRHVQRLSRKGKPDLFRLKVLEQAQIDGLLNVHVSIVVRYADPINDLEIEGRRPERLEVGPIETSVLLRLDRFFQSAWLVF